MMAPAQKPDFVFRRNGRVHLNERRLQFNRLLAAEGCASAVIMPDTPCSEVVWRVLATRSIRQFHLHFPSRASPCAITFQLDCTSSQAVVSIQVARIKLGWSEHCVLYRRTIFYVCTVFWHVCMPSQEQGILLISRCFQCSAVREGPKNTVLVLLVLAK